MIRRPLWRLRLTREIPRYLLCALSLAGIAASVRYAIAAPMSEARVVPTDSERRDVAAEGYALLFARRYLTWNAAEAELSGRELSSFAGPQMEPAAGLQLPAGGQQQVAWAAVVQERESLAGEHVYTVAAQTIPAGLLYLTVSVVRTSDGRLALAGYPAFVGPPATSPAQRGERLREATEPALATVVVRALRNYLAGADGDLAADLTSDARVSVPTLSLTLNSLQHLFWAGDHRSVLAEVQAHDDRGVRYLLGYELDVVYAQGRWEISAVQMDPTAA